MCTCAHDGGEGGQIFVILVPTPFRDRTIELRNSNNHVQAATTSSCSGSIYSCVS